jgi:uncharacterized membrane protein YphA (DoxX/SURF4 family)
MSDAVGVIVLVGRILFIINFGVVAGVRGHLAHGKDSQDYARSTGFALPYLAGWPSGVWLVAASLSLGLGIWPDVGALMLGAFVVPAAWYFHRFWEIEDPMQRRMGSLLFYRNVSFLGASLVMFGSFVSFGDALRFSITGPLFDF